MPLKTKAKILHQGEDNEQARTLAHINDLTLWEDNPRFIEEDKYKQLLSDIKDVEEMDPETDGQFKPLIVTTLGVVIGGNMRMRAYTELGKTQIWVSVVDTNNPAQAFKIAIRDNMRYGTYDEEKLAEAAIKYEITELELEGLDVDLGETTSLKAVVGEVTPDPQVEEDEQPEVEETFVSKPGTIYQLGRHRLMCGDSTSKKDVALLMGGGTSRYGIHRPTV